MLSENNILVEKKTGERTKDCIVRREVELIEVATFIHEEVKILRKKIAKD